MGGTFLEKVMWKNLNMMAVQNGMLWDPEAVKTVFDTEIKIDMVALESTNQVPMTWDVRQAWANERHYPGVNF